jgi:hypothetical protein
MTDDTKTLRYKATERYSLGWTDPRVMASRDPIKIGKYALMNLYVHLSGNEMEITCAQIDAPLLSIVVDKAEFATYIEAFLKEQRERNNSRL